MLPPGLLHEVLPNGLETFVLANKEPRERVEVRARPARLPETLDEDCLQGHTIVSGVQHPEGSIVSAPYTP